MQLVVTGRRIFGRSVFFVYFCNTMHEWRWDQGRILYFQYDVLKEISRVLVKYDGRNINEASIAESLKAELVKQTGLPFLPTNYKVNRNYARVFQCAMLATSFGKGQLVITDICRKLALDGIGYEFPDDYFIEVVRRFRYPYPAFQEYDSVSDRVYPFIAIIKFLISRGFLGLIAKASLLEIASYLIGNRCTGLEDIEFYKSLKPTGYMVTGDKLRQLREMVVFISQLSFLKVFDGNVFLDVENEEVAEAILRLYLKPFDIKPCDESYEEFLSITSANGMVVSDIAPRIKSQMSSEAMEFAEGGRRRVQHLRIERSPLLRQLFIRLNPDPVCNACGLMMKQKYPWTDYLLDIHHLLPLSSVLRGVDSGTTLRDMVGLCPSCHRAVHQYYSKWLYENGKDDFSTRAEAMDVYLEAVREIA